MSGGVSFSCVTDHIRTCLTSRQKGGALQRCADSTLASLLRKPPHAAVRSPENLLNKKAPLTFTNLPFQRVLPEVNAVHIDVRFASSVDSPDHPVGQAGVPAFSPALLRQQRQHRREQPDDNPHHPARPEPADRQMSEITLARHQATPHVRSASRRS